MIIEQLKTLLTDHQSEKKNSVLLKAQNADQIIRKSVLCDVETFKNSKVKQTKDVSQMEI